MWKHACIVVTLDTKQPIEIGDFVAEFISVADQYEKFVRENYPDLVSQAHVYVREVKKGFNHC